MNRFILKSSFWLLLSQVLVKGISFGYNIFLARNLSVEEFGLYSAALAYFSLVAALSDIGITRYLMRELSLHGHDSKKCGTLISTSLLSRVAFSALFFALFTYLLNIYDPDKLRSSLSSLAILAVLPQSVATALDAILIVFKKAKSAAIASFVFNLLIILIGVLFIQMGYGVAGIIVALIIASLLYSLMLVILTATTKIELLGAVGDPSFFIMLKGSLPYGVLAMMGLIYFKVDSLILSYLKGNYDTGIYSAAYRFLEAVVFIPSTIGLVLFPVLAKDANPSPSEIKKLFKQILIYMGLIGSITTVAFIFILPMIIEIALPRYIPSILVMQILSLAIPFMFIHIPLSQILLSSDRYLKQVILASLLPLLFNIVANFMLVPNYGYLAAAWVTVVSDIISLSVLTYLIHRNLFR